MSNQTKHTPGPWITDIKQSYASEGAACYSSHPQWKNVEVCNFRHDPSNGISITDPETIANANLIAAAPDLLLALMTLIVAKPDKPLRYMMALDEARAAVNKALGKGTK